ncbi:MAG: DUF371 domain-containing protein [Candidatus Hodarchaeota archaeon]
MMQHKKILLEEFYATSHQNVRASHKTTLEFTRSPDLTTSGNCVLGVNSSIAPVDFKEKTKDLLRSPKQFLLEMEIDNLVERIKGTGHPDLALSNEEEMVLRKSDFISDRTVLINCDKASVDLDPGFKKALRVEGNTVKLRLFLMS